MSNKPDLQEEEIDLGNLFQQIGTMFRAIFNFIENLFTYIFRGFISFLLFIRKNIKILIGATLLGTIIGFIFDFNAKPFYSSNMTIEVGYNSGAHLYKRINYLNDLLAKEDTVSFAHIFNFKEEEVSGISSFKITPIDSKKYDYIFYDEFQRSLDTAYVYKIEFEDFINRITETDYPYYNIEAIGKNQDIFTKLNDSIVTFLENNYFAKKRDLIVNQLLFEKSLLQKEITQIDSLRKRYKETAYLELKQKADKNSGVSFKTVNKPYKGNLDIDLYSQTDSIRLLLKDINEQLLEKDFVVKVQTAYNIGTLKHSLTSKTWVQFGLLGFVLAFLIIIGIQFNKYLNRFEKKVKS